MKTHIKRKISWLLVTVFLLSFVGYTYYLWQSVQPAFASTPRIGRTNNVITLYGKPYTFTGINAYELATYWGDNAGCGGMLTDNELDTFFSSLRPNSVVRFWAFQDLAMNYQTGARSWTGIDRVFASAEKYGQFLLPTMANHWNACDGGNANKNDAWYNGGYNTPFSADGNTHRVSFWGYMHELVARYKNSSALGMWELVNEPEMSCGNASQLKTFFDTVGGELKNIDPNHLLEMGVIGGNQCSLVNTDYATVLASNAIDVATFHDYGDENTPMPYPGNSGLAARITQSFAANKPIIVGEAGMNGNDTTSCRTTLQRKDLFNAKISAAFTNGVSGYLPWNWGLSNTVCTFDIAPGDSLLTLLHDFSLPYDPRPDPIVTPPSPSPAPSPSSPVPTPAPSIKSTPSPQPTSPAPIAPPSTPSPSIVTTPQTQPDELPLQAPQTLPTEVPKKTKVEVPLIASVSVGTIALLGITSFLLYKKYN